jgi:hypothetical protein
MREQTEARCRTVEGVHIPGCMGCAVHGHAGCTCPSRKAVQARMSNRVRDLEHRLAALELMVYRKQAPHA